MKRRYVTVDVFTARRFGGNPLAVVLDAGGLDGAAMLAITREFNYSETTFVLPPKDKTHTAHVRIFTPAGELPFAGHPNVGTAYALARIGKVFDKPIKDSLVFEEAAGLVPVRILLDGDDAVGAQLTAPQRLTTGANIAPAKVAKCLGLEPADIVATDHAPLVASVGTGFLIAALRDREALRRARGNADAFAKGLAPDQTKLLLYTRGARATQIHARMFFLVDGLIREDPATGSANAALAALLAELSTRRTGTLALRITQGEDMGRPSLLLSEVDKSAGSVGAVRIGGHCVPVMEGLLEA
jgi:trans-2,3-dihydro-3-hydroxyanthranilate isomerase